MRPAVQRMLDLVYPPRCPFCGQVLGPLCTGAVLLLMNVDEAARIIGAGFIIISLAFLALGRPAARTNTETA